MSACVGSYGNCRAEARPGALYCDGCDRDAVAVRADLATLRAQLDAVTRERDEAVRRRASDYDLVQEFDVYGSADLSVCLREMLSRIRSDFPHALDAARLDLAAATLRAERAERVVEAAKRWHRYGVDRHLSDALAAYDRETGARS